MKKMFDKLDLRYVNLGEIEGIDLSCLERKMVNDGACAKCGGACCKTSGCAYVPSDFKDLSFDGLKAELDKGKISIIADYSENDFEKARKTKGGNEPILHLMARNRGRGIVNLASRPCCCACLTKNGCIHPIGQRPLGGLLLIPKDFKQKKHCESVFNIEYARKQWAQAEIQKVLKDLVVHYSANGKTFDEIHLDAVEQFGSDEKLNELKGGEESQWAEDRLALYMVEPRYAARIRQGEKRATRGDPWTR